MTDNTSDSFHFNYTRHFDSSEEQSASGSLIFLQFTYTVSFFCISCPILLFIIHYEQFSADPQKRSISNMIFSNMCFFLLTQQANQTIFIGIRTLFGPLYHRFTRIGSVFHIFFVTCFQISTIACLFFKNLKIISPSITLSLNDEFWYSFVSISTITLSLIHALSGRNIIFYFILSGDSSLPHFSLEQFAIRKSVTAHKYREVT